MRRICDHPTMRRAIPAVMIVATAGAALGGSAGGDPRSATASGKARAAHNGRISFQMGTRSGLGPAIYAVKPGNHPRQLTHPAADGADFHPSWSPGGRRLVFERQSNAGTPHERNELYTFAARSGPAKQLTRCTGKCLGDDEPDWSPKGGRIAFFRANGPLDPQGNAAFVAIFKIRRDGTHLRQLTQRAGGVGAEDHFPTWSPNGSRLAFERIDFSSGKARHVRLFIVRANGRHAHRIKLPSKLRPGPDEISWSPNGRRLLFSTYCTFTSACPASGLKNSELFSVRIDGSGLRQLAHTPKHGNAFSGAWSPNGRRIVFARHVGRGSLFTSDLFTIRAPGADLRHLTHTPKRYPHHPDWGVPPR